MRRFAAPVLSAIIGAGYTGGKNLSVGALESGDFFGHAVSLSGTRLAVAARNDDGEGNLATDAGAVYLFTFADQAFNSGRLLGALGVGYSGACQPVCRQSGSGRSFRRKRFAQRRPDCGRRAVR